MVLRIQHHHLFFRLAQRHGHRTGYAAPARCFPPPPSVARSQSRLQPLSTSPIQRQELRPTPETPPTTATTPADSAPTTPTPPTPNPNPNPNTKTRRRLAPRLIFALTFTLLGATAGSLFRALLSPPAPPTPGTEQDAYTARVLHDQAARLPVVRQLSSDPAWEASWDAYESLAPEHRARHISAGALAGARGVGGYQRVFYRPDTGELVSVVFFGPATTGWPGVVHGGCLATILDESCGRAAFKQWGERAGLTARLELHYRRVTLANGFYVVRVRVRPEEELPESERGKRHYKCFVDATIENAATGQVTVAAEALFVGGAGKDGGKNRVGLDLRAAQGREEHARF